MRSYFYLLLSLILGITNGLKAQPQRPFADYKINATLDMAKKEIDGNETITWKNCSNIPIKTLQLHLYMNAFKDSSSTFMREKIATDRQSRFNKKDFVAGNIYLNYFRTNRGENLYRSIKFIQPDDNNVFDKTVIEVKLERDLQPNQTIVLEIGFKTRFPKVIARTGYGKDGFLMAGQWFPKIGVFEKDVDNKWVWNCHQFHANTEFYADFGKYEVNLAVPSNYIIGATGKQLSEVKLKNDYKSVHFVAEKVHDFAFTVSPRYKSHTQNYKGITLIALMQPEHNSQAARYFEAAIVAIDYFEKTLGKYPYSTLTMVDPPLTSFDAGGMEYPTLITCGSVFGVGKNFRFAELVTVHEFGHQYFQGMLASNEFEQSFMDEGFNQYMEGRIMDEKYGEGSQMSLFGFNISDIASNRNSYVGMPFPEIAEINQPAWKYPKGTYGILTYTKPATALQTFENLVGREKMDIILKNYFTEYKFKHPKLKDFIGVVNQTMAPKSFNWYFEQAFDKSYSCDYKVDSIVNKGKKSSVYLSKKGQFVFPVNVQVNFNDGSSTLSIWDTEQTDYVLEYNKEVLSVVIDPNRKNLMDLDLMNNSMTLKSNDEVIYKYFTKFLFWSQNLLSFLMLFIG